MLKRHVPPETKKELKEKFLTTMQAAKFLGINTHETMSKLNKEGLLVPSFKLKRKNYYSLIHLKFVNTLIQGRVLIPKETDRINMNVYKQKMRERKKQRPMGFNMSLLTKKRRIRGIESPSKLVWAKDYIEKRRKVDW